MSKKSKRLYNRMQHGIGKKREEIERLRKLNAKQKRMLDAAIEE